MRKVVQSHTRLTVETKPTAPRPEPTQRIQVQNIQREKPKLPVFSSTNLINQVKAFCHDPNRNYYLGFGGLGDALLLMAVCWENPKAKVVFFANQMPFIRAFFDIFGIGVYLHDNIMGTKMANHIFDYMKSLPGFRDSAHLADGLDYGDWANEKKYVNRIRGKTRWIQHLGKAPVDKPVVIIGPSGSHKDIKRQRYLNVEEYKELTKKHLAKGYKVYATGSMNDLHFFGLIDKPDFYWLNSDTIYDGKGVARPSDLKNMLRIINSAEHVLSMDTWLKTYTLLCGIPTTVVETRWEGRYKNYGEDITDFIFLNRSIWPHLTMAKIESLLAS